MTEEEDRKLDELIRKALFVAAWEEGRVRLLPHGPDNENDPSAIYFSLTTLGGDDIVSSIKWP